MFDLFFQTISAVLISLGLFTGSAQTFGATPALTVPQGGTGWGAIQANTILLGNGTSRLATTSAGTNGQILSLVSGVPAWVATTTFSSGLTYSNGNVTNTGVTSITATSPITRDTATGGVTIACATCLTSSTGVSSITGTANQITASASVGAVTLSLPNHVIFPGSYFASTGTTTNATSTSFGVSLINAIGSGGIELRSSAGTQIATLGAGGGSNVTFAGGVNIDGTTRLATSLTGLAYTTSGTVSAVTNGTGGQILSMVNGVPGWVATTTAGTGLTFSAGSFNVNTTQNITALSNLTTNALVLTGSGNGTLGAYTGTSCTNQFVRSLSALGVATCATVDLANDITGTLAINRGGTATTTFYNGGVVFYNSTLGTLSQASNQFGLFYNNTTSRLGIGSSSPDSMLVVSSSTTATPTSISNILAHLVGADGVPARLAIDTNSSASTFGSMLRFNRNFGTAVAPSAVTVGNTLGTISFDGYGTTGYHASSVGDLAFQAEATFTDTSAPTRFQIFTTSIGSITSTERARIDNIGRLGLATTSPFGLLTIATSTRPQITLSDGTLTSNPFNFFNTGNSLFIATSSPTTFATSTAAAFLIDVNGRTTLSNLTVSGIAATAGTVCLQIDTSGNITNTGASCGGSGSPAGTGTELQYRNGAAFGAVASSAFSSALGAVGLGTTSPRRELTLSTSTEPQLMLTDSSLTSNQWNFRTINGNLFVSSSSPSTFATSTLAALTITSAGNIGFQEGSVGIGTTSPTKLLHVVGSQAGGIMRVERVAAGASNSVFGTYDIALNAVGSGFNSIGPALTFSFAQNTNALATIGDISSIRIGADTTGGVQIRPYAAGTALNLANFYPTGGIGFGTTTIWSRGLTISTSSIPQLSLTDGSITADQWNFRAHNNNFMLATSSASTGATSTRSVIEIDTNGTLTLGKVLTVANGGTGAATFTTNGVLYGNTTSAIQVTAQGGANTVLIANAGAPSFSASPTIGTSVTTPILYGGSAVGSTLTVRSTSGAGVGADAIIFGLGNNGANEVFRMTALSRTGFGTTTPRWLMQLATSTAPQLTLSDNGAITNDHWSFRNIAGRLFVSTSSASTFATSTASGLWFDTSGRLNTQKSISVTDGTTARYISGFNDRTFLVASSTPGDRDMTNYQTGTSTFYVWNPFKAQTLLSVYCRTSNNTLIVNVGTGSATTTNGTNGDVVCTPTGTTYTMTTNASYTARGNVLVSVGSATTTKPNNVTITTTWTEQAD